MKAFKWIIFFISFILFQPLFADDILSISEKITQLKQQALQNQNSMRSLFQIEEQLKTLSPFLENCAKNESEIVNKSKEELIFLEKSQNVKFLEQARQKQITKIRKHQERLSICKYSLIQVKNLNRDISIWNKKLYQGSYYLKYQSFLSLLSQIQFNQIHSAPIGYPFQVFLSKSSTIRNLGAILIILSIVIFFKLIFRLTKFNFFNFHQFKIPRFLFISLIYLFIAPVQYILLKIIYSHRDVILLTLFEKPLFFLLTMSFLIYMYQFYKSQDLKKEVIITVLTCISQFLIIRVSFTHYYFELYNISSLDDLYIKYQILILQQILMFLLGYWLVYKILETKKYPLRIFIIFQLLSLSITTAGLYGYIDMAINIKFSIIIDSVLIVWLIIFHRIKNMLIQRLRKPEGAFKVLCVNIFGDSMNKALQNMKVMIYILYCMTIFLLVFTMSMILFWFLPDNSLEQLVNFMFSSHSIQKINITPVRYVYALIAFYFLNIINYATSSLLARKLFVNSVSIQKTGQLFYFIGLVMTCIVILILAGFEFENFVLILGGLSFGIGLSLKNVLSNMFSSFFLFVNRPYDLGDFIEINHVTGYVKKMTLFETFIETADENVMILPNTYVASSVVQNYTYNQKNFHKVHVKYLFSEFHLKDENTIKDIVTEYIKNQPNVLINRENPIKLMFFPIPHSGEFFGLELIFSVKKLKNIEESTAALSSQILMLLKNKGFEVKFEQLWHPLKHSENN